MGSVEIVDTGVDLLDVEDEGGVDFEVERTADVLVISELLDTIVNMLADGRVDAETVDAGVERTDVVFAMLEWLDTAVDVTTEVREEVETPEADFDDSDDIVSAALDVKTLEVEPTVLETTLVLLEGSPSFPPTS